MFRVFGCSESEDDAPGKVNYERQPIGNYNGDVEWPEDYEIGWEWTFAFSSILSLATLEKGSQRMTGMQYRYLQMNCETLSSRKRKNMLMTERHDEIMLERQIFRFIYILT